MFNYAAKLSAGLSYAAFLEKHATPEQHRRWEGVHAAVKLSEGQKSLLESFTRKMPVVVLAGAWCGDCVNQCPIFDHFAKIQPLIELKFFDRDAHPDVAAALRMCGGARVPMLVFLSEDGHFVSSYGDKTLSTYRRLAAEAGGAACPTGLVVPENQALGTVTGEWLNEFERAQLVLRLSSRLRQLHGD